MNLHPAPAYRLLVRATATAALLLIPPLAPAEDASSYQTPTPVPEFPVKSVADAGADPAAFMEALTPLYDGSMQEVHSILILSGGALVYEDYFVGNTDRMDFDGGYVRLPGEPLQWMPDDLHYVASVANAVTALVSGIALQELGWSLDEPIAPHFNSRPGLLDSEKARITARQLLTMTSGLEWDEWAGTNLTDLWSASMRFIHLASLPMASIPGTHWRYNSAAPNLLLLAIDDSLMQGVRTFADARFFLPLGIDNYRWGNFQGDIPDAGQRLFMRPRDMAKIGLLLLNQGEFGGVQIVPREFANEAMSNQVSTDPAGDQDYGYLMWIRKLVVQAGEAVQYVAIEGDGGNNISLFPDRGLVVVTTGGSYGNWPVYGPQGQRLLQRLVPLFPVPQPTSAAPAEPKLP